MQLISGKSKFWTWRIYLLNLHLTLPLTMVYEYHIGRIIYIFQSGFFHLAGFPGGSDGKEFAYIVGGLGSIPGSGRSPGEGNGNALQHSCLENPMDRGAWRATVHRLADSQTQLSNEHFPFLSLGNIHLRVLHIFLGSSFPLSTE